MMKNELRGKRPKWIMQICERDRMAKISMKASFRKYKSSIN
jgi:hypothetical protein